MANNTKINDLIKDARKFSQRGLLQGIASIAAALDTEPGRMRMLKWPRSVNGIQLPPQDIALATHSLAALTRVVLAHGNRWETRLPVFEDVVTLQNHVDYLTESPKGKMTAEEFFFQLAYQQFPFQIKTERRALARALVLYERVPELLMAEGFEIPFNLGEEFTNIYGMSMRQFIWSGLWAFGAAISGSTFKVGKIDDKVEKLRESWPGPAGDVPTGESVRRVLRSISLSVPEFAASIGDLRKQDQSQVPYDYQPLLEFPLVRQSEDEYVCPVPKLLIDRFTSGLFHDFANALKGAGKGNAFRAYFGRLFERYVGMQLGLVFDNDQLEPETQYGHPTKSTPDWVVNNPSACLAFECRSSTFTLGTRMFADTEGIFRDLGKIGGETIGKLWPKLDDIWAGVTPISMNSTHPPVAIISTFELLEPLGLFGGLMLEAVKNMRGQEDGEFHLVPIDYLEYMCATKDPAIFKNAVDALMVDESWLKWDNDANQSWRKAMPDLLPTNPIIEASAREFLWMGGDARFNTPVTD